MYEYLTDIECTIRIGFCTSVDHAKFMKDYFNRRNIESEVLYGDSKESKREELHHVNGFSGIGNLKG